MTATNHALTGAAVAAAVQQPFLALPLAFLSHFACDSLPHFGVKMKFGDAVMYRWLTIDGLTTVAAALVLLSFGVGTPVLLAVCGFVAMSPDLAWLYYGLKGVHGNVQQYDPLTRFHSRIQWYQKVPGIFIEFGWAALMISVILRVQ